MELQCKNEGCTKYVHAKELCGAHYQQWRRVSVKTGERIVKKRKKLENGGDICSVNNCTNKWRSLGYCVKHYYHFHLYGSPTLTKYKVDGKYALMEEDEVAKLKQAKAADKPKRKRVKQKAAKEYIEPEIEHKVCRWMGCNNLQITRCFCYKHNIAWQTGTYVD